MAPEERQSDPPLIKRLFEEYYRFSFFKAVALLEGLSPGKKKLGETLIPGEEAVRFSAPPGLSFPPSDLAGLREESKDGPVKMDVAFMGLTGPSGVLPHWYNEMALETQHAARAKTSALVDFYDLFHHRLISLFYLAWKRVRLPAQYAAGAGDRLSGHLLSLIGLGTPGLSGRIGLPEEALIFCSGLLARQVPSAAAIQLTVEYLSGTHAEIHQFVERVISLDPDDWTRLGSANAELGGNAVCGSEATENQSKFRIHLGPVDYERFVRFLPTGNMLGPIFSLVRYMVGIAYEFETRIYLRADEVPACRIGMPSPSSPRLGWSTWIRTENAVRMEAPFVTFQEKDLGPPAASVNRQGS
jgi:type VI secretion system protein ImpH